MQTPKYKQLTYEAKWAIYLTLLYLLGWILCAYLLPIKLGLLGFPIWFEFSCIYLPILFVLVALCVIKAIYKNIDLDSEEDDEY